MVVYASSVFNMDRSICPAALPSLGASDPLGAWETSSALAEDSESDISTKILFLPCFARGASDVPVDELAAPQQPSESPSSVANPGGGGGGGTGKSLEAKRLSRIDM
jgi:hypothetical protein